MICLVHMNKTGMYKVSYYYRTTKSSIQKSCSDVDNKDILPVSTSYWSIWNISYSGYKEKEKLDIFNSDLTDSNMSESLSYLIFNYWGKREVHINTDYSVTGWMLCVITHIYNDGIDNAYGNNRKQFNNVTNKVFMAHLMVNFMVP